MTDLFQTSGSSPTNRTETEPDFILDGSGSVYLLRPRSESARNWIDQNIGPDNGFQPYYPTVVIEHRYVADILEGIAADGFEVRR